MKYSGNINYFTLLIRSIKSRILVIIIIYQFTIHKWELLHIWSILQSLSIRWLFLLFYWCPATLINRPPLILLCHLILSPAELCSHLVTWHNKAVLILLRDLHDVNVKMYHTGAASERWGGGCDCWWEEERRSHIKTSKGVLVDAWMCPVIKWVTRQKKIALRLGSGIDIKPRSVVITLWQRLNL